MWREVWRGWNMLCDSLLLCLLLLLQVAVSLQARFGGKRTRRVPELPLPPPFVQVRAPRVLLRLLVLLILLGHRTTERDRLWRVLKCDFSPGGCATKGEYPPQIKLMELNGTTADNKMVVGWLGVKLFGIKSAVKNVQWEYPDTRNQRNVNDREAEGHSAVLRLSPLLFDL